jgi:hypothetical protein
MAEKYAEYYGLPAFSGSDNHRGSVQKILGGMGADSPIRDEWDFISRYYNGELKLIRRVFAD